MRSPADAGFRLCILALAAAALTGCGLIGGGDGRPGSLAAAPAAVETGPAADYPITLGEPFTVEGELYTPADTLNYDSVGYATLDDGAGVTLAHRTLPLPSYVEVTSLASGKTILARVERRGPMAGSHLVALSPAAAAQLGEGAGAAVRVRRVNPPEADRAELRAGRAASPRIETPKALVEALRRKLPASGSASLRPTRAAVAAPPRSAPVQRGVTFQTPPATAPVSSSLKSPEAVAAYPLPSLASGGTATPKPVVVARSEPVPAHFTLPAPATKPVVAATSVPAGGYVVQAGAFANSANARRAAEALGGYVSQSGRLYRVRTGPFTSRGQAEAALAKVRAAGYSDARVYTAG